MTSPAPASTPSRPAASPPRPVATGAPPARNRHAEHYARRVNALRSMIATLGPRNMRRAPTRDACIAELDRHPAGAWLAAELRDIDRTQASTAWALRLRLRLAVDPRAAARQAHDAAQAGLRARRVNVAVDDDARLRAEVQRRGRALALHVAERRGGRVYDAALRLAVDAAGERLRARRSY